MYRRLLAMVLIGVGIGSIPACNTTDESESDNAEETALAPLLGEWRLRAIRGEPIDAGAAGRPPSMAIARDGGIGGFGGVNSWGATLKTERLAGGDFEMTPAHTTLMAGPPEAMELERRFLEALREAGRFELGAEGELTLRGDDDEELLRFVRAG